MKKCPKCGALSFYTSAHVVQDWLVDSDGNFMRCMDDCIEVTHFPDDDDLWECANCSYCESGDKFNV